MDRTNDLDDETRESLASVPTVDELDAYLRATGWAERVSDTDTARLYVSAEGARVWVPTLDGVPRDQIGSWVGSMLEALETIGRAEGRLTPGEQVRRAIVERSAAERDAHAYLDERGAELGADSWRAGVERMRALLEES
jgi:hypothetical protein